LLSTGLLNKEVGKEGDSNFDNVYTEIDLVRLLVTSCKEIPIVKTLVGVVKSSLKSEEIFFMKILTFEVHSGKLL
jgi:hypothetical protein